MWVWVWKSCTSFYYYCCCGCFCCKLVGLVWFGLVWFGLVWFSFRCCWFFLLTVAVAVVVVLLCLWDGPGPALRVLFSWYISTCRALWFTYWTSLCDVVAAVVGSFGLIGYTVFANRAAIKEHEAEVREEYENKVRLNQLLHLRASIPEFVSSFQRFIICLVVCCGCCCCSSSSVCVYLCMYV